MISISHKDYFTIKYKDKTIKCLWHRGRTLNEAALANKRLIGHKGELHFQHEGETLLYHGSINARKNVVYIAHDVKLSSEAGYGEKETYISPFSGRRV